MPQPFLVRLLLLNFLVMALHKNLYAPTNTAVASKKFYVYMISDEHKKNYALRVIFKDRKRGSLKRLTISDVHQDKINSIAISPDEEKLVTASDDGRIGIWALPSGKFLGYIKFHSDSATPCYDVRFVDLGTVFSFQRGNREFLYDIEARKIAAFDNF